MGKETVPPLHTRNLDVTAPMTKASFPSSEPRSGRGSLRLGALTALVIGSMIGGGIFALPQNTAVSAAPGAMLIGWAITAFGMLALALVFHVLAERRPDLEDGIYAYARAGFGHYVGFLSAWGYWISAWVGTTSYLVLLLSTLGYFFPVFNGGNTAWAVGMASALLWFTHAIVSRGIKTAAFLNEIATVAKIVPLILFIVMAALAFRMDIFSADIWGFSSPQLGSVMDQVKGMMLVTVWVFIGIEGASVCSARAEKKSDVGKATVIGFLGVLVLLVMINVLSMGILSRAELAGLEDPSMAYVLEQAMGPWGAVIINVGLVISLLGAMLSWMVLCAEVLFSAAADGSAPAYFRKENSQGMPSHSLLISNILIQSFLIVTLYSEATYLNLMSLGTSMILVPYLLSAAFAFKVSLREGSPRQKRHLVISGIAILYSLWLIYAAGIQYFLLSSLLYAPGVFVYIKAQKENGKRLFTPAEAFLFALLAFCAVFAGFALYAGHIHL